MYHLEGAADGAIVAMERGSLVITHVWGRGAAGDDRFDGIEG